MKRKEILLTLLVALLLLAACAPAASDAPAGEVGAPGVDVVVYASPL